MTRQTEERFANLDKEHLELTAALRDIIARYEAGAWRRAVGEIVD